MIQNIKIFDKLLNITANNTLDYILNSSDINYEQVLYDNELDIDYGSEEIDIKTSHYLEDQYIETYANEFKDFFLDVRKRNSNELIDLSVDKDIDILYKNDLYELRQNDIRDLKNYFLSNINHFKRFKGTKDYTMFIITFYLELKFNKQYGIKLTTIDYDSYLVVGERYRILATEKDYFGIDKKVGNLFTATESLYAQSGSVQVITSSDTEYITSGKLSVSKRYKIINYDKDNPLYITSYGDIDIDYVPGNIISNKSYNFPNDPLITYNNILVELPPTIITKLKETVYNVQSILNEDIWNLIIKPLVHPVGWLVYYTNLDTINLTSDFLQTKDIRIKDEIKLMNLGYIHNNPILNGTNYYSFKEINNINLKDTLKLNSNIGYKRAFMDFTLLESSVSNYSTILIDHKFKLVFSNIISDDFEVRDITIIKNGTFVEIEYDYVIQENIVYIKPELENLSLYKLTIKNTLKNKFESLIKEDIEIKFTTG